MRLIFLGPPGAGKGTQAALLAEAEGWPHISTGDIFRRHLREGTALGERIRSHMDGGELVPDELTMEVAIDRLEQEDCREHFILDGFPRTVAQADALERYLAGKGQVISAAIDVNLDDQEIIRRLSARRSCRTCGRIYHLEHSPPLRPEVCDGCGGELYQRDDDDAEVIRNRLRVYREQTAPLVAYYRERGMLHRIDGSFPPAEVAVAIRKVLGVLVRS